MIANHRLQKFTTIIAALLVAACFGPGASGSSDTTAEVIARQPNKPLSIFRDCSECPEMVVIPAGTFLSGFSEKEKAIEGNPNIPLGVKVTIPRAFAIGKFELTVAEYRACIAQRGCQFRKANPNRSDRLRLPGMEENDLPSIAATLAGEKSGTQYDRMPMVNLSVEDIKAYLAWISKKTGRTYRLPTRIEWSYAARAGTSYAYPWGDEPGRDAAFVEGAYDKKRYPQLPAETFGNNGPFRHPVGLLSPNSWGLYDVIGNVAEIVFDCRYNPSAAPPNLNSLSTENEQARICVLGDFDHPAIGKLLVHPISYGESMPVSNAVNIFQGIRIYSEMN